MSSRKLGTSRLSRVLAYENKDVIHRFRKLYDVTEAEAEDLFTETKKWLWLCAQPSAPSLPVTSSMHILDEMWHNFMLFTRDYARFCQSHFGRFIHHNPTRKKEEERARKSIGASRRRAYAQLKKAMQFVYDNLGETTLWKWHVYYPLRYPPDFFKAHSRPLSFPVPEITRIAAEAALTPPHLSGLAEHVRKTLRAQGLLHVSEPLSLDEFRWLAVLVGDVLREETVGPEPSARSSGPTPQPEGNIAVYIHLGPGSPVLELRPRRSLKHGALVRIQLPLDIGRAVFVHDRRYQHRLRKNPAQPYTVRRLWVRSRGLLRRVGSAGGARRV